MIWLVLGLGLGLEEVFMFEVRVRVGFKSHLVTRCWSGQHFFPSLSFWSVQQSLSVRWEMWRTVTMQNGFPFSTTERPVLLIGSVVLPAPAHFTRKRRLPSEQS